MMIAILEHYWKLFHDIVPRHVPRLCSTIAMAPPGGIFNPQLGDVYPKRFSQKKNKK